jgi:hypothetical protein
MTLPLAVTLPNLKNEKLSMPSWQPSTPATEKEYWEYAATAIASKIVAWDIHSFDAIV